MRNPYATLHFSVIVYHVYRLGIAWQNTGYNQPPKLSFYPGGDKINVTLLGESRDQTIISYHIYDCTSPESGNN